MATKAPRSRTQRPDQPTTATVTRLYPEWYYSDDPRDFPPDPFAPDAASWQPPSRTQRTDDTP